ncbi:MAG: UvrD-helicase domain-containing protein [Bacilli bacterium]|nr:UvrD-helicase domain-containing protein [Bacilli bacterium]
MTLDTEQELASKYLTNHSIIIAGAGSGKTTTLLNKVENLIKSGINPTEILVLSFTNETVNNFIKKCKYNIDVFTFHKAAMMFLNRNIDIVDENILDDTISNFLIKVPDNLKRKIFHVYMGYFSVYSAKRYNKLVKDMNSQSLFNLLKNLCKIIKTNNVEISKLNSCKFSNNEKLIIYCVNIIQNMYNKFLADENFVDFDDIIIQATENIKNCENNYIRVYKHILVDEYQDISQIRFNFLYELVNSNNAILTVVGDDWQSIYRFSGSNLSLFYDFQKYFPTARAFFLNNTYRCPKKVIDISSKFIQKNNIQIKKNINSNKTVYNSIKKIFVKNKSESLYAILKKIPTNKSVLILSRNNYDIYAYINSKLKFKNEKFYINSNLLNNVRYMSIHKSKGLEADCVIILNLENSYDGLPSKKCFSIVEKIIDIHEPIKYAEERRLFYVAMTRCKEKLYLIINKNNPSKFISEI